MNKGAIILGIGDVVMSMKGFYLYIYEAIMALYLALCDMAVYMCWRVENHITPIIIPTMKCREKMNDVFWQIVLKISANS